MTVEVNPGKTYMEIGNIVSEKHLEAIREKLHDQFNVNVDENYTPWGERNLWKWLFVDEQNEITWTKDWGSSGVFRIILTPEDIDVGVHDWSYSTDQFWTCNRCGKTVPDRILAGPPQYSCSGEVLHLPNNSKVMPHHCDTEFMQPPKLTHENITDLLGQLHTAAMKAEDFWTLFEKYYDGQWTQLVSFSDLAYSMDDRLPIRQIPPKVEACGFVDQTVIDAARDIIHDRQARVQSNLVARAILELTDEI